MCGWGQHDFRVQLDPGQELVGGIANPTADDDELRPQRSLHNLENMAWPNNATAWTPIPGSWMSDATASGVQGDGVARRARSPAG